MPRIGKGPRLYKRKTKRKNGRIIASAVWTIRDGEREVATGIFAGEAERKPPKAAEDALAKYITSKYQPSRRTRDIEDIDIADVLAIYHAHREGIYIERKAKQTDITEFADRIGRLNDFFGGMMLVEVNAHTCSKYVKARRRPGGARRDLEDLRAAINHHSREGLHRGLVRVALPAKGRGRDRWLTRSEAAALLWTCWRYREVQTQHRGALKNQKIETDKRPLRHIHCVRVTVSRSRPIVCRSRARYLLPACSGSDSHQEAPATGAIARSPARTYAALGSNGCNHIALC